MNRNLAVCLVFIVTLATGLVFGDGRNDKIKPDVPNANPRLGHPANIIAPGYSLRKVAEGSDPLENPSGVITKFGFLNDFPPQTVEATKTEPDENTYVVFDENPGGPTPGFNYGRHFLYQGHENAADFAYITRINLDVNDPAHRITLLTPVGSDGKTHFGSIDGSTWDPFTRTLLFTQERGTGGGVIQVSAGFPAQVATLDGIIGKAGYEGIHPDDQGNLLVIEDTGGTSVPVDPTNPSSPKNARNPNSFVYRFVPYNRTNLLAGGKLEALQVSIDGAPLKFVPVDATHPNGDVFSDAQLKLHTPGSSWPVRWVTVHDTGVLNPSSPQPAAFDANQAAKDAGATPFKRPENAQFIPGSDFKSFVFDPTGDTNANSGSQAALAARGAWGSIFRVDFNSENHHGEISILVLGTAEQSSFDNLTFIDPKTVLAAEDRGDTLHLQLNRLDSIWAYDVRGHGPDARRFLALGRDTLSESDAALLDAATPGYQNEGDNEPTGLHISEGAINIQGLVGKPQDQHRARWFFTQQHGKNTVYEILTPRDRED
ncbi:MAG TPA: alkaline phosphatase PhoX [Pyrinomonadaceae bacterium]|nr:alkaline phosphatase PhoX [Pyrinomonadaceae bacterium]